MCCQFTKFTKCVNYKICLIMDFFFVQVACVVVKTGYNTLKGQLIRSILFPKELGFEFYAEAMKFVGMLFGLAAFGMIYCVYLYVQRGVSIITTFTN